LKRAAEQEGEVAEKKQKIDKPSDDLEDDSWADALGSTAEKPAEVTAATTGKDPTATSRDDAKAVAQDMEDAAAAPTVAQKAVTQDMEDAAAAPTVTQSAASAPEAPDDSWRANCLTVCFRSISYSVQEDQFELDCGDHGDIEDFHFLANRGMAFVTYADKEGVAAALKMNGDEYWGRKLSVDLAEKKKIPQEARGALVFEAFVKGLPSKCTEELVRTTFSPCGEIVKLKMRGGDEDRKGTAYVEFKSQEDLDKALKMDGNDLEDGQNNVSKISVTVADQGKGKDKGGKGKGKGKDKGKGKGKGKKGKGKGGR